MKQFLDLPKRFEKPRTNGLTILIDNGYPINYFKDVLQSYNNLIDKIKFGWGTAVITKDLEEKIKFTQQLEIDVFLGGTFFEKSVYQNKVDDFVSFCKKMGCNFIEISNGTIPLSNEKKAEYISKLSDQFTILSEVGYKDVQRSLELSPAKWIKYIKQDLEAGADKVILEARESGKSGIARADGQLRYGLIEEILESDIDETKLIFEAPNKKLQVFFIKRLGTNTNFANISFQDVIGLETLRLGLRGDTLMDFDKEVLR